MKDKNAIGAWKRNKESQEKLKASLATVIERVTEVDGTAFMDLLERYIDAKLDERDQIRNAHAYGGL